MNPSRRTLLGAGLLGLTGALSACGGSSSGGTAADAAGKARTLSLWCWGGGLSEQAVTDAAATLAGRAKITSTIVDGDFKQHLVTALSSGRDVPDITGVKGEDMPVFLTKADEFLDLNPLGASQQASSFAAAKYAQATTPSGKQIGLPIDLGPTAIFYRSDLWDKAGLPSDPTEVANW